MILKKKVVKIGASLGIILDKIIIDNYNIEEGDFIDISDLIVTKKENKK